MKKFFILGVAVALCFALVAGASAFEGASLESQTTFDLYDRSDPFDLSIDPGLLYQVDRWRLYTNLSNYEGTPDYDMDYCAACTSSADWEYDGAYYMLGTSGKLGAGSLALFYETNKLEYNDDDYEYDYRGTEWQDPDLSFPEEQYTGRDDRIDIYKDWDNFEGEIETHNFLAAYSMDFGIWSLGLSYSPEFIDEEGTLYMSDSWVNWNFWSSQSYGNAFNNGRSISPGDNNSTINEDIWYGNVDHDKYHTDDITQSHNGDVEIEERNHEFKLGSMIRPADHYDVQVTVSYTDVDTDVDASGTATYDRVIRQKGDDDGDPGDFSTSSWEYYDSGGPGSFIGYVDDGYVKTQSMTMRYDGALPGYEDSDGDYWGIAIRPTYHVNDIVALDLEVEYETGDGDISGDYVLQVNAEETRKTDASDDEIETWTSDERYDDRYSGDWDADFWKVEPRVYLTYGPVEFSLGVGYEQHEYDSDYRQFSTRTSSFSYDNGDDVDDDTNDWTAEASRDGYEDVDEEWETTAWTFPVATRFKVTDKLTFRAGARYTRQKLEWDRTVSDFNDTDEFYELTLGDGTVVEAGPEYEVDSDGVISAYDRDTYEERDNDETEDTIDITEYRLGLGYQVTENLTFDLMFKETKSDSDTGNPYGRGGVDVRTVWASVVLAF